MCSEDASRGEREVAPFAAELCPTRGGGEGEALPPCCLCVCARRQRPSLSLPVLSSLSRTFAHRRTHIHFPSSFSPSRCASRRFILGETRRCIVCVEGGQRREGLRYFLFVCELCTLPRCEGGDSESKKQKEKKTDTHNMKTQDSWAATERCTGGNAYVTAPLWRQPQCSGRPAL